MASHKLPICIVLLFSLDNLMVQSVIETLQQTEELVINVFVVTQVTFIIPIYKPHHISSRNSAIFHHHSCYLPTYLLNNLKHIFKYSYKIKWKAQHQVPEQDINIHLIFYLVRETCKKTKLLKNHLQEGWSPCPLSCATPMASGRRRPLGTDRPMGFDSRPPSWMGNRGGCSSAPDGGYPNSA